MARWTSCQAQTIYFSLLFAPRSLELLSVSTVLILEFWRAHLSSGCRASFAGVCTAGGWRWAEWERAGLASHRLPGQRGHSSPRIPSVVSHRPQVVSQSALRLLRKCSLSAGSLRFPPTCLISAVTQTTLGLQVRSEQHRWEPRLPEETCSLSSTPKHVEIILFLSGWTHWKHHGSSALFHVVYQVYWTCKSKKIQRFILQTKLWQV